jgi:GAF domain-containing protein
MSHHSTAIPPLLEPAPFTADDLGLFDRKPHPAFDGITRLAARLFGAPVALVSIIDRDRDRQVFASQRGVSEPWRQMGETPLSHSFCQHVQQRNAPLVVEDARTHDLVKDNLAIPELNVVGYLGVPIHGPDGEALGALCVTCPHSHRWTEQDVSLLEDLAACASEQVRLRASLLVSAALNRKLETAQARGRRFNTLRASIMEAFSEPGLDLEDRFSGLLSAGCTALDLDLGAIVRVDGDAARTIAQFPVADRDVAGAAEIRPLPSASVTARVISGQEILHCNNCPAKAGMSVTAFDGSFPGGCIAAPLVLDGVVYGALEFIRREPSDVSWGEAEVSTVGIIATLVTSLLGVYGQIDRLRQSESALLDYILDLRAGRSGGGTLA